MIEFVVPPTLLQNLEAVPADRPVALLLRHSVRDAIPEGETGNELPLTDKGVELARELGAKLQGRLVNLHASPVRRCVETAEYLRDAAGLDCDIWPDRLLGDPGIFVENAETAWETFQAYEYWDLIASLIRGDDMVGMRHGPTAVRQLTEHSSHKWPVDPASTFSSPTISTWRPWPPLASPSGAMRAWPLGSWTGPLSGSPIEFTYAIKTKRESSSGHSAVSQRRTPWQTRLELLSERFGGE